MSENAQKGFIAGVENAPNATYAFAMAFFDEVARSGVQHVCVSPGSRSTPLAVAAGSTPSLTVWSHLDERASAFFALGLAKTTRRPVALVCTSGTALANYAPAVIEAHYAGVPLLVLSADRPPELREWGAGQTIDQTKIFGAQVRFFAELPIPEADGKALRYARTLACRAVAESRQAHSGPVHLNWPLREPLAPVADAAAIAFGDGDRIAIHGRADGEPYAKCEDSVSRVDSKKIKELAARFSDIEKGVIACGVMDEPGFSEAVARLGATLGWPIFAEPTAGLRSGAHVIDAPVIASSDLFLRDKTFADRHVPTAVLRFGATPVSKALRLWFEAAPPEHTVLVSANNDWNEPSHLVSDFVVCDPGSFCHELCDAIAAYERNLDERDWLASFLDAEERSQAVITSELAIETALLEPRATRTLCEAMPPDSILYVSSSMPIRDLDAFMPASEKPLRVLSNRGAIGIDGMVSSALGAASAREGHVFLLTGDLAFLYDVGGLLAARRYPLQATIVVLNNDGGGIFSFLPVAEYGESVRFDELFNTPHGADLSAVAPLYGLQHVRVTSWSDYTEAINKSLSHPGISIVEVPVDRDANLEHFRNVVRSVGEAVDSQETQSRGEGG